MTGKSSVAIWMGLAFWPGLVQAAEWPQFRGPESAGVAESAFPTEWGPDKNVQWKVKIPGLAWSSPIVWGDKIFLTTATTENQTKPQAGGGMVGRGRGGGGRFGGPPQPGQILPPFLQTRMELTADQKKQADELQKEVDTKLATLLTDEQKKELKEPSEEAPRGRGRFGGPPQPGQILPAPVVERLKLGDDQKKQLAEFQKEIKDKLDKILTDDQRKQLQTMREGFGRGRRGGFGGGGGGRRGGRGGMSGAIPDKVYQWQVLCLDRETGKVLWKEQALEGKPRIAIQQSNTYATETPVTDGERVYAYFGMHGVFCYDFAGKLVWKKDLGSYPTVMGQGPASSPVLDGERLFLQIDNEEKSFLVALNTKTGDELWRVSRNERTNHCSPVVWKNKLRTELVTSGSRKVRSYDPATGKLLWELGMGGGRCYSSPVGDAELLYVGSEPGMGGMGGGGMRGERGEGESRGGGGGLYAVRADASGDVTLKEGETSNSGVAWSQSRGGPEKASPLIYQGHLYVLRTNGGIVTCYDAKTGKQLYRQRIPGATAFWTSPWAGEGKIFCLDDSGTTHVLDAGPQFKELGTNKLNEMFWASPAIAGKSVLLRSVENLYCIRTAEEKK
ncbi:MAG TPA: PQQ-binding-like beta-propeller repeat protein [Planctomycetaceae bacterium]|jgi:outer membrane protein assembly factor BamB/Spy/CpxP family protein refolding chaperone|nr:PQQ-binding-like beta-propeller repeat protein [Planctomycetaceae bacterium]